jgi:hypothetical protein
MLYVAIDLSSLVFTYKIVEIGSVVGAASSLIFPLTYSLMDVIAEVYGFRAARRIIWYSFICDFIFATVVLLISHIPSTTDQQTQAYVLVLGMLSRAVIAQMVGVLSGAFINIYLLSKWKIMTKGRYFWLRSIGSSILGEAIMLVISVFIALYGVLSYSKMLHLIFYAYIYKIIFAFVVAPILCGVVAILKRKTGLQTEISSINLFDTLSNRDFSPTFQKS